MNDFDELAAIALNEAPISSYLKTAALGAAKGIAKGAAKLPGLGVQAVGAAASGYGKLIGGEGGQAMQGIGRTIGRVGNAITAAPGSFVKTLQTYFKNLDEVTRKRLEDKEKKSIEKLERPVGNPKVNDPVSVDLPFISPNLAQEVLKINAVQGNLYTIYLPENLSADTISLVDKPGYQTQIKYSKDGQQLFKPADQKTGTAWPVYVGLHYHQRSIEEGYDRWIIDQDTRQEISNLDNFKKAIVNNQDIRFTTKAKQAIMNAKTYDELKQALFNNVPEITKNPNLIEKLFDKFLQ